MSLIGRVALLLTLGIAVGCGTPKAASVPATGTKEPLPGLPVVLPNPVFENSSDLAILVEGGARLHVGDPVQEFDSAYPRPSLNRATVLHDLPVASHTAAPNYDVRGWSLDTGQGAGALIYENRVALAMAQFESVDQKTFDDRVKEYQRVYGEAKSVQGRRVNYWFWQRASQTLMLCGYQNEKKLTDLTVAVGDTALMKALSMSPDHAIAVRDSLDKLFNPSRPVTGKSET